MREISKYQRESFHQKLTSIVIILVLVAIVFATAFVVKILDFTIPSVHRGLNGSKKEESSKIITISGNLICLSTRQGKTDSSQKCKVGIIDSKGKKYAISGGGNILEFYGGEAGSNGVEVSGEFQPVDENEIYDIVGTIKRS